MIIRPDDDVVYGDSGYLGIEKSREIQEDSHLAGIAYRMNRRPSHYKKAKIYTGMDWEKRIKHQKSSVRSKIEHRFLLIKKLFVYNNVGYRGLAKTYHRFCVLFTNANWVMCIGSEEKRHLCSKEIRLPSFKETGRKARENARISTR